MSLRINILANYASQMYVAAAGFLLTPIYIRYMGSEAYGLVSLFVTLQAWFQLLDFGISPTLARETARRRAAPQLRQTIRALLRTLEIPFAVLALLGSMI